MTTLHQLRCFLMAYEQGSLTAAAAELGHAQPSVSEQVRVLERSLGARLFERVGRGLVPTEAAHELVPHARQALAAVEAGRGAVRSVSELETGTVRFGVFGTARIYLATQVVLSLLQKHPGVRVELIGQNSWMSRTSCGVAGWRRRSSPCRSLTRPSPCIPSSRTNSSTSAHARSASSDP